MYLSCKKKEVVDQAIYTSANTNREDKAHMNQFKDKIAEAI